MTIDHVELRVLRKNSVVFSHAIVSAVYTKKLWHRFCKYPPSTVDLEVIVFVDTDVAPSIRTSCDLLKILP